MKTKRNRIATVMFIRLALFAVLTFSIPLVFSGCFLWNAPTPEWVRVPEGHYRLHTNFANGVLPANTEGIPYKEPKYLDVPIKSQYYDWESKTNVFTVEAYHAAAAEIADYLSDWTGLDFTINDFSEASIGVIVDWSKESTLLSGLHGREQKEDFLFSDDASLYWFMMDSLASTLTENLPYSYVYYCAEGKQLVFPIEDCALKVLSESASLRIA